jgi:uncharacterized protein YbaR (Trm112 family)
VTIILVIPSEAGIQNSWHFVRSSKNNEVGVISDERSANPEGFMAIDQELLAILACPKCKGEIRMTETGDGLTCGACRLKYPITDDIPIMLIDEAVKI